MIVAAQLYLQSVTLVHESERNSHLCIGISYTSSSGMHYRQNDCSSVCCEILNRGYEATTDKTPIASRVEEEADRGNFALQASWYGGKPKKIAPCTRPTVVAALIQYCLDAPRHASKNDEVHWRAPSKYL